jgi:hypothetical protein
MKKRPILFSAPMVRALLDGSKTQTRRLIKPQPYVDPQGNFCWNGWNYGQDFSGPHIQAIASPLPSSRTGRVLCPYGKPGDRLWVRETFAEGIHQMADVNHWAYAADHFGVQQRLGARWKPSIHMPRAASRITLEVIGVRVERLQDISDEDSLAEGIYPTGTGLYPGSPRAAYQKLWESINGPGSWEANPWVWVVEFPKI